MLEERRHLSDIRQRSARGAIGRPQRVHANAQDSVASRSRAAANRISGLRERAVVMRGLDRSGDVDCPSGAWTAGTW